MRAASDEKTLAHRFRPGSRSRTMRTSLDCGRCAAEHYCKMLTLAKSQSRRSLLRYSVAVGGRNSDASGFNILNRHHQHRFGHTVRIIVQEDLPTGKAYAGDVIDVKAGYARNFLIPKKMALYATRKNFEKLGMIDPEKETEEQRRERMQNQQSARGGSGDDADLRASDMLKHYLRNKEVRSVEDVEIVVDVV